MSQRHPLLAFGTAAAILAGASAGWGLAGPFGPATAQAAPQVYEYRVEHPLYGDIGTYTNIVDQSGDSAEVETKLNIVVKLLGVVVHRQAAERREDWEHGRLTLFRGVTETNGQKMELSGEAHGDTFIIHSPLGQIAAPANVHPSNPWSAAVLDTNTVMSTKSGKLFAVHVDRETTETVMVEGKPMRLRQVDIKGDKRQFVWLDDHDVPVAFRTEESGQPIDFVLTRYPSGEPQNWPGPEKETKTGDGMTLQQAGFGGY